MKAYVEFGLEHPDEYQLTFMVHHASLKFSHRKDLAQPFEQQGIGVQSFLLFRDRIAGMVNDGLLKPMDVTLAAQTVWVAVHGLVALLIARPGYVLGDRRLLIDTVVETVIRGLQSSPPKVRRESRNQFRGESG
jgi:hypothetical protein